jgi:hypothetical protein
MQSRHGVGVGVGVGGMQYRHGVGVGVGVMQSRHGVGAGVGVGGMQYRHGVGVGVGVMQSGHGVGVRAGVAVGWGAGGCPLQTTGRKTEGTSQVSAQATGSVPEVPKPKGGLRTANSAKRTATRKHRVAAALAVWLKSVSTLHRDHDRVTATASAAPSHRGDQPGGWFHKLQ